MEASSPGSRPSLSAIWRWGQAVSGEAPGQSLGARRGPAVGWARPRSAATWAAAAGGLGQKMQVAAPIPCLLAGLGWVPPPGCPDGAWRGGAGQRSRERPGSPAGEVAEQGEPAEGTWPRPHKVTFPGALSRLRRRPGNGGVEVWVSSPALKNANPGVPRKSWLLPRTAKGLRAQASPPPLAAVALTP